MDGAVTEVEDGECRSATYWEQQRQLRDVDDTEHEKEMYIV